MSPELVPFAVVWIDSREAIVARRDAGSLRIDRIPSDVPPHRRSTRHVRYDPAVGHGGGAAQTPGEERRLEHLGRFLKEVRAALPAGTGLLVLGPGTVHERLAGEIRGEDAAHGIDRPVACEVARRLTSRQLVARLRVASGDPPRRRTRGAHPARHPSQRRRLDTRPARGDGTSAAGRPAPSLGD